MTRFTLAALLLTTAAHAQSSYAHLLFHPLTDKAHCTPPEKDREGRVLRYYAPGEDVPGVPAKDLGREVERFVDHAYFQFFLSSDPVPKMSSVKSTPRSIRRRATGSKSCAPFMVSSRPE